ncbi:hypothetical protein [Rufibacter roseus]|uniref:Uncharacterized protein n=1 Tax=Rufibacter roseus TaxID=1567108 RepID=A0ABW2DJS9_9BACT|nr:hypothetical protein [Rufibacter roseus]
MILGKRPFALLLLITSFLLLPVRSWACTCAYSKDFIQEGQADGFVFEASFECALEEKDLVGLIKHNIYVLKVHRYWGKSFGQQYVVAAADVFSSCSVSGIENGKKFVIASKPNELKLFPIHMCNTYPSDSFPDSMFQTHASEVVLPNAQNESSHSSPCNYLQEKKSNFDTIYTERETALRQAGWYKLLFQGIILLLGMSGLYIIVSKNTTHLLAMLLQKVALSSSIALLLMLVLLWATKDKLTVTQLRTESFGVNRYLLVNLFVAVALVLFSLPAVLTRRYNSLKNRSWLLPIFLLLPALLWLFLVVRWITDFEFSFSGLALNFQFLALPFFYFIGVGWYLFTNPSNSK